MSIGAVEGSGVHLSRSLQLSQLLLQRMQGIKSMSQDVGTQQQADTLVGKIVDELSSIGKGKRDVLPLANRLVELTDCVCQGVGSGEFDSSLLSTMLDSLRRDEQETTKKIPGISASASLSSMSFQSGSSDALSSSSSSKTGSTAKNSAAYKERYSEMMKRLNDVLKGGGIESLSELGDIRDILSEFSDLMDRSVFNLIKDKILDFTLKEIDNIKSMSEFQSFIKDLMTILEGMGQEFLSVVADSQEITEKVAKKFGLDPQDAKELIKGTSPEQILQNKVTPLSSTDTPAGKNAVSAISTDLKTGFNQDTKGRGASGSSGGEGFSPQRLSALDLALSMGGSYVVPSGDDGTVSRPSEASSDSQDDMLRKPRPVARTLVDNLENKPDQTVERILEAVAAVVHARTEQALNNVDFGKLGK